MNVNSNNEDDVPLETNELRKVIIGNEQMSISDSQIHRLYKFAYRVKMF